MAFQVASARLPTGLTLPYVEQGSSTGIRVVFVHAYVDSWRSFERVLPHLPRSIHAFSVTQRGHGDADKPASGYRIEELSAELAAFMDAIRLDAALIVGSSSGGYVAQRFALDYRERALGIVLIGTPRTLRDKPRILDAVSALQDPVDPTFVREFVQATTSESVPPEFLESMIVESCKVPAHVWKAALQDLVEAVPPTETGTIIAPTLILWGDRDDFLPRSDQVALAVAIPGSTLTVYEGAGHVVHWEEPERVAANVVSFAESIAS